MDSSVMIAVLGIAGTLLSPVVSQFLRSKQERERWERDRHTLVVESRIETYSAWISASTRYATRIHETAPTKSSAYQELSLLNARLQVSTPERVVGAAQKVITVLRDMQNDSANAGSLLEEWHTRMDKFIELAREDVLSMNPNLTLGLTNAKATRNMGAA